MDKPCDICGSARNKDLMLCCSQCNRAREHIYCMRVNLLGVPVEWFCDQCLSSNEPTLEGGSKKESSRSPCLKAKKSNGTGKMKFISPEEAIKLSSGAMRPVPPRTSILTSSNMASKLATPLSSKVVKPKLKANPSSGCLKTPRKVCEQIRPVTNRQHSRILNELEDPKAIATTVNDYICNEEPLNSFMRGKETGTYNTNTEKASCRDVHHIVPEFKDSGIEERGPLSLIAYRYLVYRPAQDVTWKGGFKIHGECYDGFWGQPPFRVRRKAYEFSKTLYPVLEVKLVSRCHLWTNLFCDGDPDFCDIGLYFLPGNLERSKDNLARLFELMEIQDVAMETCINGVELLIFTSSKLHENSEMLMDDDGVAKSRFLWGVFCPGREGQAANEDMDMEIDMMGGVTVGSVDVPVPSTMLQRPDSTRCSDSTIEQQQLKLECDSTIEQLHMDVPPGFEKKSSLQKAMVKNPETFNPPSPRKQVMSSVKVEKMDL